MKRYFSRMFGNNNIVDFFVSAMEKGSVSHAYIIEGDKGSGKGILAKCICSMLSKGDDALVEKIMSGACPDITEYSLPEKRKFIPVETIRSIKKEAYIKPSELDIRGFIIRDAHMMTAAGQNALLKLLEEPPRGVYFFLLCENAASLLPTVRSRAPIVRMQRFSDKELSGYLKSVGKEMPVDEQAEKLLKSANGSIGVLLDELENRKNSKEKWDVDAVVSSLEKGDFSALLTSVLALPQDRKALEKALSALGEQICLHAKNGGKLGVCSAVRIYKCIEDGQKALEFNMNTQILKVTLAKQLMRATK